MAPKKTPAVCRGKDTRSRAGNASTLISRDARSKAKAKGSKHPLPRPKAANIPIPFQVVLNSGTNRAKNDDLLTDHVQKFRFQYVNSKPVSQMEPGSTYWDRVSLSIPCREVWHNILQDPRFSREVATAGARAKICTRTLIPLRELSSARLRDLALCVWKAMSEQGRRHLSEQYWRARAQSFENYVKKLDQNAKLISLNGETEAEDKEQDKGDASFKEKRGMSSHDAIPDPEPLADSHHDPYLMRGRPLAIKKGCADSENRCKRVGEGNRYQPKYNALRQSQNVSDSPTQFLNSLRCCYAEVAAPKGAFLLLRGNSHNQSGKQVLAEYIQHPELELGSDFWRDADADEALAGYLDSAGRLVPYPWRQRLVRVICPIPKDLIAKHGSGGLKKQLNSSKLMRKCDAEMLRTYAEEWRKKREKGRVRGTPGTEKVGAREGRLRSAEIDLTAHKRRKTFNFSSTAFSSAASSSAAASSAVASSAVASSVTPIDLPSCCRVTRAQPTQPSHASYGELFELLERTRFPKSGQRPNVAGFESLSYLIFGLHRRRSTGQLDLTDVTKLAQGRLGLAEDQEDQSGAKGGEEGDQAEGEERTREIDAAHYRVLLESVLGHFREVGLGVGPSGKRKGPPSRSRRLPGIRNGLRGKFIPAGSVFFTSVMVAKNLRTFMHRDANNKGPSYQVVVSNPSHVDSGEFQGGNLLAWPDIQRADADQRVAMLRGFWEERRQMRQERRERMRHVNPVNARWTGENDEVTIEPETGKLLLARPVARAQSGRDGYDGNVDDGTLPEELPQPGGGGIGLRNLSDEALTAARHAVYYGNRRAEDHVERGEPTHDEDATIVRCVHRYVSFYGKQCFHATQPWTPCANRYCITFFGINLEGGGARHAALRRELEEIGFRPHPISMEDDEDERFAKIGFDASVSCGDFGAV